MRSLSIVLLYDVPYAPENTRPATSFMLGEEWEDERDVFKALRRLGHKVDTFGVHDDIAPLVERLRRQTPDVIFNMCETFNEDRAHEAHMTGLLELLGIPYTGATPQALAICKDKGLSKKVLSWHGVRVPAFTIVPRTVNLSSTSQVPFPAIVKPLAHDGSFGIARDSLVKHAKACQARLAFIHDRLGCDAIVEEYIDGRELYVGVFGNERLTVLPPTELRLRQGRRGAPRFLTFRAKWDASYRQRHGISSAPAAALSKAVLEEISRLCRLSYRALELSGYARIDLRLAGDEPVVIEVNPNPSIKRRDDFAEAAVASGLSYEALLERIVGLALARARSRAA